ncbi:hypothetical protein D9758_012782 [Tetrapyrgos nigripes]|uniref:Uncharacterized protein n=1 Tax=Tetrapyrgos nigripes TaxID=182062 RepID=A0A8H5CR22_9AGAR|nr:hypothetical protein D9758_012782 [Tetrapyrgos nigripes]
MPACRLAFTTTINRACAPSPLAAATTTASGLLTLLSDTSSKGPRDGTTARTGGSMRSYCCDVPQALPVPFGDVFPSTVKDSGNDLFTVDFDPDEGSPKFSEDGTASTFTGDDNENNGAFGEVFIDSPNPGSVSSLDLSSDWVLTSCDPRSDQPQTILAYCSKANSDSCQHVFIGGAEHTIAKLPTSCGLGPHTARKPATESLYQLSFDYNFAAIPASNGPVYMRADVTDMPGYWDSVVDSPPERRAWLKSRGLWKEPEEKRWWGAFKDWLSKLNQVEASNTQSRTFPNFIRKIHGQPSTRIYTVKALLHLMHLLTSLSLDHLAKLTTRYGFYLQGQIVPPSVEAAYIYFNSGGNAATTFTMTGTASVTYNSDTVELAKFGFPGLYYPGLLTIGPSLAINGYITGQLSLTGTLTTGLTYQFPEVHYALGKSSDDAPGPAVTPDQPSQGYKYSFGYNVNLNGDLQIHVVPTVELGISVLGGSLIDANAFVAADLYGGVEITGSVSKSQTTEFCINPHYGLILSGGVTGSVLYWEASPLKIDFYSVDYTFMSKCFTSVDEPTASATLNTRATDLPRRSQNNSTRLLKASEGTLPDLSPPSKARIVVSEGDSKQMKKREIYPISHSRASNSSSLSSHSSSSSDPQKRALVPPIVASDFLCPQADSQIRQQNSDNNIYSDAESLSNNDDGVYRRGILDYPHYDTFSNSSHIQRLLPRVQVATCGGDIKFDGNAYTSTVSAGYWNLADPTVLDPKFKVYPQAVGLVPGANVYGREHVYELQLLTQWIDNLATQPNIFQNAANNVDFCTWAVAEFNQPSPYQSVTGRFPGVNTVVERLRRCEPSNTLSVLTNGNSMRCSRADQAFGGKDIKTKVTFDMYGFSKKVFEIRAASGVISYLESGVVADEFVNVHNCVLQVWTDWYTAYVADPTVDAPNRAQYNVPQQYRTWIQGKISDAAQRLVAGIQNMITWYGLAAGGNNMQEGVELDYGDLEEPIIDSDVSADDLTTAVLNPIIGTNFFAAIGSRL